MDARELIPFPLKSPVQCPRCALARGSTDPGSGPDPSQIVRYGFFYRKSQSRFIRRFKCKICGSYFSRATFSSCYRQKKRQLNSTIAILLCSGMSQRRVAKFLKINRKTVARKLLFLAKEAELRHAVFVLSRYGKRKVKSAQFDELETFERSKCLPLSVALAVERGSRVILGFSLSQMPAKGPLAAVSRKRYGKRADHRAIGAARLLNELGGILAKGVTLETDQNPNYPVWVRRHLSERLPKIKHKRYRSRRGCVSAQGELKRGGYDPLFSLNHTCAMLRANINRLFRKTWCTTKRPDRLKAHLWLYVDYHNRVLLA